MENSIKKPNMLEVAARLNTIDKSIYEGRMESFEKLFSTNFSKNNDFLKLIYALVADKFDLWGTAFKSSQILDTTTKSSLSKSRKKHYKEIDKLRDYDDESESLEIGLTGVLSTIMGLTRMPKPAHLLSFKSISILLGIIDEANEKKLIKKYGNDHQYALYELFLFIISSMNSRGNVKHVLEMLELDESLQKKLFGLKNDSYALDNTMYSIFKTFELKQVFLNFVLIMNGLTQPKDSKEHSRSIKKLFKPIIKDEHEFEDEDIDNYFDNSNEITHLIELFKNLDAPFEFSPTAKSANTNQINYFEIFKDFCNETLNNIIDLRNLISTAQFHGINERKNYLLEIPEKEIKNKKHENLILFSLDFIDPLLKTLDFATDYIKARLSYELNLRALNLGKKDLSISIKDLSILAFTSARTIKNELWREDSLLYIKKNNVRPIKSNIKSEPANSVDFLSFQDAHLWLNHEKRKIPFNNLIDCTEVITDFIDTDFFRDLKQKKL